MKQIYTVLAESLEKMTTSQRNKFFERRPKHASCEVLVNLAEAILKGETKKESTPIVKNNGARDNGHVLLTESTNGDGGGDIPDVLTKAYKLCESYVKLHRLSEDDARRVVGLPLKRRKDTNLTEKQYRHFELAVLAGRRESDALATAKLS